MFSYCRRMIISFYSSRRHDGFTLNNLSVYITAHKRNISSIVLITDYLGSLFNFFYLALAQSGAVWALKCDWKLENLSHGRSLTNYKVITLQLAELELCVIYWQNRLITSQKICETIWDSTRAHHSSNAEKEIVCETRYGNYPNENILEMLLLFWRFLLTGWDVSSWHFPHFSRIASLISSARFSRVICFMNNLRCWLFSVF